MSSRLLSQLSRTISFRLNLWYASIFILSAVALFVLLYALMSVALDRKEREVLESRLKEYAAVYRTGRIVGLQTWYDQNEATTGPRCFVAVVTPPPFQRTFFQRFPPEWQESERKFELGPFIFSQRVVHIPRDEERELILVATELYDGRYLVVGRSANKSRTVLQPFRRTFIAVMTPIILLGFVGGALFSHRAMQPIRQILATARSIVDTGDLDQRVPVRESNDELDE